MLMVMLMVMMLVINEDTVGIYVESMNYFTRYVKNPRNFISGIENFNPIWTNKRSKRLQHDAGLTHAKKEPHKAFYMELFKD